MPLKIAAKVDRVDRDYFDEQDQAAARLHAVSNTSARSATRRSPEFLSGAIALLMPIDWPEPFGLVMIEAMACGTPVIAFNRGSVPEVVEDGVTGFIVEDETGAIGAVDRLAQLSRERMRQRFEERFTARRMATDYLARLPEPDGVRRRRARSLRRPTARRRSAPRLIERHRQASAASSRPRFRHQRQTGEKPSAAMPAKPRTRLRCRSGRSGIRRASC